MWERKPKAEKAAFLMWGATCRPIPSASGEPSGGHLDTPLREELTLPFFGPPCTQYILLSRKWFYFLSL